MAFTYLLPITNITAGIEPRVELLNSSGGSLAFADATSAKIATAGIEPRVELLNSSGGSLSFADATSAKLATAVSGSNYYLYTTQWPSGSLLPFSVKVSNHSTGSLLGIAAFNSYDLPTTDVGAGGIETTINIVDGSSNPIQGVECWITTDSAGANTIAGTNITDNFGNVTFYLDAGIYYIWKQKPLYGFINPTTITVS